MGIEKLQKAVDKRVKIGYQSIPFYTLAEVN